VTPTDLQKDTIPSLTSLSVSREHIIPVNDGISNTPTNVLEDVPLKTKIHYADIHAVSFASLTPHTTSGVSTSYIYSEDTYKPNTVLTPEIYECDLKEIKISDKFFQTNNKNDKQQPSLHRSVRVEIDTAADATVTP
jgi:hypothetical protein